MEDSLPTRKLEIAREVVTMDQLPARSQISEPILVTEFERFRKIFT